MPLCHVCQSIINSYPGESKANRIASALFSLMTDQANFIDMCLVHCFNKACMHPHLQWLQACTDLTNKCGFQAHNIAIRHHLMEEQLTRLLIDPKMGDHCEAICGNDPDGAHFHKLELCMTASLESLHKHFKRWTSTELLPAALMSEAPFAKATAAVTLKTDMPPPESFGDLCEHSSKSAKFVSEAHGQRVSVSRFN